MNRKHFVGIMAMGASLAAAGSVANAAVNVTRNGVTWDGTYEGDVGDLTLSSPTWQVHDRSSGSSESTDGDIRTFVTPANESNSYAMADTTWTGAGNMRTAEARIRVADADGITVVEGSEGQGSLVLGVNDVAYDFRFYDGSVTFNVGGAQTSAAILDTTEFHTYRVTVDQTATPVVSLYIDGNTTPAFTSSGSWFTSPGFDRLLYGDISTGGSSAGGSMDVDFISWEPGAIAPVPEPSVLALAGLGAAALLRRRRTL